MPVNQGDTLIIPAPTPQQKDGTQLNVRWSQSLRSREANYYAIVAENKSQENTNVPIFIASEWYTDDYLSGVGVKLPNGDYELWVGDRLQYGQKTPAGDKRFVVLHDKERKIYQHRFTETAIGSLLGAASKAAQFAQAFDAVQPFSTVRDTLTGFVGDYLKTF